MTTPHWAKSMIQGSTTGKIMGTKKDVCFKPKTKNFYFVSCKIICSNIAGFKDFADNYVALEEVLSYQPGRQAAAQQQHAVRLQIHL